MSGGIKYERGREGERERERGGEKERESGSDELNKEEIFRYRWPTEQVCC